MWRFESSPGHSPYVFFFVIEVTEHQALKKQCPYCGKLNREIFPENIRGPVQYGERMQALTAYFAHQHFIPVDRICQIFEDVFGVAISPGTCANVEERLTFIHIKVINILTLRKKKEIFHTH